MLKCSLQNERDQIRFYLDLTYKVKIFSGTSKNANTD